MSQRLRREVRRAGAVNVGKRVSRIVVRQSRQAYECLEFTQGIEPLADLGPHPDLPTLEHGKEVEVEKSQDLDGEMEHGHAAQIGKAQDAGQLSNIGVRRASLLPETGLNGPPSGRGQLEVRDEAEEFGVEGDAAHARLYQIEDAQRFRGEDPTKEQVDQEGRLDPTQDHSHERQGRQDAQASCRPEDPGIRREPGTSFGPGQKRPRVRRILVQSLGEDSHFQEEIGPIPQFGHESLPIDDFFGFGRRQEPSRQRLLPPGGVGTTGQPIEGSLPEDIQIVRHAARVVDRRFGRLSQFGPVSIDARHPCRQAASDFSQ